MQKNLWHTTHHFDSLGLFSELKVVLEFWQGIHREKIQGEKIGARK